MAFAIGIPAVYPSAHVKTIQSAVGSTPADCKIVARRTPVHSAMLIRLPPTSLLTHSNVTNSSTVGCDNRSTLAVRGPYEYVVGFDTKPSMERSHVPTSTGGSNTVFVATENSGVGVSPFENDRPTDADSIRPFL